MRECGGLCGFQDFAGLRARGGGRGCGGGDGAHEDDGAALDDVRSRAHFVWIRAPECAADDIFFPLFRLGKGCRRTGEGGGGGPDATFDVDEDLFGAGLASDLHVADAFYADVAVAGEG